MSQPHLGGPIYAAILAAERRSAKPPRERRRKAPKPGTSHGSPTPARRALWQALLARR